MLINYHFIIADYFAFTGVCLDGLFAADFRLRHSAGINDIFWRIFNWSIFQWFGRFSIFNNRLLVMYFSRPIAVFHNVSIGFRVVFYLWRGLSFGGIFRRTFNRRAIRML